MNKTLLSLIFLLTSTVAGAQYRFTCFDLYPGSNPSSPGEFTSYDGHLYFNAWKQNNGSIIWKSDGTLSGSDTLRGRISLLTPVVFAGKIFFSGSDTLVGTKLWCTDGTWQGTTNFINASTPGPLTVCDNLAFFSAQDVAHGRELWMTDGTPAGTQLVLDANAGGAHGNPHSLMAFGSKVCYTATDGTHGEEPWISDGTAAGTFMLKDIRPGSQTSSAKFMNVLNGMGLFYANNQLWITDGTTTGTQMVIDTYPGGIGINTTSSCVYNNKMYFCAKTATDGYELWETDGTTAGSQMVKDINPGATSSTPFDFFVYNNKFYFAATTANEGRELWSSDGTAAGTQLVSDILPGTQGSSPDYFIPYNGKIIFRAQYAAGDLQAFETDGTSVGTKVILNVNATKSAPLFPTGGFYGFCLYDSALYMNADYTSAGAEVWKLEDTSKLSVTMPGEPAAFTIYPNPANSTVTVQLTGSGHDDAELKLYDITGRLQCKKLLQAQATSINLWALPRGVYEAVLTDEGKRSVKKLVLR